MPTKAELEAEVVRLQEEVLFCHQMISKLGQDFKEIDEKWRKIQSMISAKPGEQ